ncbi:MAG: hypothetical protein LBF77_11320 [Spirochaetaceae bacterium]|jgi:hypothetical protein|nr:hypothetical protein [Spirochaetaceae bacterium]
MTDEDVKKTILDILEKNQGLTIAEIANNWLEPPERPSKKRDYVGDVIIDLIQEGSVFFECEQPSIRTLVFGNTPYRFFTKSVLSQHRIV